MGLEIAPKFSETRAMIFIANPTTVRHHIETGFPNDGPAVAVDSERVFETGEAWADAKASQVQSQ